MLFKKNLLLNLNKVKKFYNIRFYHTDNVYGYKYFKSKNEFEDPTLEQVKTKAIICFLTTLSKDIINARINNSNLYRLISAYRQYGHTQANINSIALNKVNNDVIKELNPGRYGFNLDDSVCTKNLLYSTKAENDVKVSNVIQYLENVYCKHISAEFMHLETEEEIEWFAEQMENRHLNQINDEKKLNILKQLLTSQVLDNFLQTKFASFKRYGGEGAESMIAFFDEFLKLCSKSEVEEVVLAMPHRGRLNLLTGLLEMPVEKIFSKLRGLPDFPERFKCTGDVISHLISSADLSINNKNVHITMLYNPSHLEAVNPVSMGKTRSKQLTVAEGGYGDGNGQFSDRILNVQVHGDAAYIGQGIDQECLVLSQVPHFEIGGTIHLVVNNQIGFTTPPDRGRSTKYCTDLAKIISAPVIHVNGLHPEEVVHATRIAFEYQRKFRKDVFVDMNCYRKWGHNELDDPTFTNPIQYSLIRSMETVPNLYADQLKSENLITDLEIEKIVTERTTFLNESLKSIENYVPEDPCFKKQWAGFSQAPASVSMWDTGVPLDILKYVGFRSVNYPIEFNIHPHLVKTHVSPRISKIVEGQKIDWATAEALAFGSLLYQGHNIRISGQDVGRGTFSHRHAMFVDQQTNKIHIPLNELEMNGQGFLEIANSILSEEAVLGYEYGMSIDNPNNLIIWEAQFGDFFNGAQIIIDTFVTSGELKWLTSSGLVMLLPHGYDGAGPEHSSSRMERFLQLTDSSETSPDGDNVNMHVVNPTTPAQYFHLLRRQIIPNYRKPLIVISPKILLRLSNATSSLSEMGPGSSFQPVLDDPLANPANVKKVILVSGKHYYELNRERLTHQLNNVAIIRLESLCPFPVYHLQLVLEKYVNAKTFIWSQEEHRNMGAWSFVKPRFENMIGRQLKYTGRDVAGTVAVGVGKLHSLQATQVIKKPFEIVS